MARRLISFDTPPFEVLVEHLAKDEDFISDAKTILQINDDALDALARALAQKGPFLDRSTLSKTVEDTLGSGENASDVSRTVWRLNQILRDADEPLQETVALLKKAISESSEGVPEDDREKLGERLEKLAAAPTGFTRQQKAERLAQATGAELKDVQIICDIRPVFNEERSAIEGAIPITTFRLDMLEPDGTSSSTEIRLTEKQLADLCVKAESARKKISVIKETLSAKSITLPFTSATIDKRVAE